MGIALPDENPAAIAAALIRLANDPALCEAMGNRGFEAFSHNNPSDFARPIVNAALRTIRPAAATPL